MKMNLIASAALVAGASMLYGAPEASAAVPSSVLTQSDFINASESTVNGVVSVKSYATPQIRQSPMYGGDPFFNDPFFEYFFGGQPRQRQQPQQQEQPKQRQIGLGSGVIVNKNGYIVTNNHVVEGAERLEVTLNDNRNFNATVVGTDATTDLAIIKIDAPDLHVIPMGDSDSLKVGEWVLAVGNPFGFTSSVTAGIVSAKARNISTSTRGGGGRGIESYIQTDAAVNSGNSGGALVNLRGELVGINTAIYSSNGSYVGCSFAIPTSIVNKVMGDIMQYGTVQRAYLGISIVEVTPELVSEEGLKGVNQGVYVAEVQDRSSAREAGLKKGDVIVAINGAHITNMAMLQEQLAKYSPGDTINLEDVREGKHETCKVKLRNSKGDTALTKAASLMDLGCAFTKVSEERLNQLEIRNGVQVTGIEDGRVKDAGIRDGFIITVINGQRVASPDDIETIYKAIMKSDDDKVMYVKGVYPTGKQAFYAISLGD